jgi:imidazolonepropionase-like amidohydrolase
MLLHQAARIFLLNAVLLCSPPAWGADVIAIQHVSVIDATGSAVQPDRTLLVNEGRIEWIGPARRARVPKGASVVNGLGKYVIPGLWDMHVHLRGGKDLIPDNEAWLSLFLANGIVGIREMGNDIPETVFQWRREINEGKRQGPLILTAGRKIDVARQGAWPGSILITDSESARAAVRQLKAMGADFVKIYAPAYPPGILEALTAEAREQGLRIGGHLPLDSSSVREAIDAGVNFIEHVEPYILAGCSTNEVGIRGHPFESQALTLAQTYDEGRARDLAALLARKGISVTPTLAVLHQAVSYVRAGSPPDPLRKYIGPGILRTWRIGRLPDDSLRALEADFQVEKKLLPVMQSAGVRLLAGSDSGAKNFFTFPGWTLHHELVLMVEDGLTPMQALQTATRNTAEFRGEIAGSGTVEVGKRADLLLLTANPLEDIRNTEKIDAVVLRGKLLRRADLDQLLADAARQATVPEK